MSGGCGPMSDANVVGTVANALSPFGVTGTRLPLGSSQGVARLEGRA